MQRLRQSPSGPSRFLDPVVLARIDDLELVARTVVDGFIQGLHRSPYLGLSLDFAEHRPYMPGDDIRRVDWRLYARTDRYYVKLFEAETNANFVVLLDLSRSMDYGTRRIPGSGGVLTKLDYARTLAACLAYFSHRQRDRVGLVTFGEEVRDYVPPSARHLEEVLHALDRATPAPRGALGPPLLKAADLLRSRGVVALVSDFYEEPDVVAEAVRGLRARGGDVIVFHVLDPSERELTAEAVAAFRDLETGEVAPVVTERIRERYGELVREHTERIARLCADAGADYALLDTATPLDHALFSYLSVRERLRRVR